MRGCALHQATRLEFLYGVCCVLKFSFIVYWNSLSGQSISQIISSPLGLCSHSSERSQHRPEVDHVVLGTDPVEIQKLPKNKPTLISTQAYSVA